MNSSKILSDLIASATGAKAHYDIWWTQISDAKPKFTSIMNKHSDFFRASQDAHFTAFFIYLAHLFDKRSDSSSIPTYLALMRDKTCPVKFEKLESQYRSLAERAIPLVTVRHKTIAHIDKKLSENDLFSSFNISWNEIRNIINDSASFVEELAEAPHQGAVGIPRDGRLGEATLRILQTLEMQSINPHLKKL